MARRLIVSVLAMLVISSFSIRHSPAQSDRPASHRMDTPADIRAIDFINFTYQTECYHHHAAPSAVTITNGEWSGYTLRFSVTKESISYGDFEHSGSVQAAVILACNTGLGVRTYFDIYLFDIQQGHLRLVDRLEDVFASTDYTDIPIVAPYIRHDVQRIFGGVIVTCCNYGGEKMVAEFEWNGQHFDRARSYSAAHPPD